LSLKSTIETVLEQQGYSCLINEISFSEDDFTHKIVVIRFDCETFHIGDMSDYESENIKRIVSEVVGMDVDVLFECF